MTTETRTPRAGAEAHICATRATIAVLKLINFMRFSAGKLSSSQATAVAPRTSMNERAGANIDEPTLLSLEMESMQNSTH